MSHFIMDMFANRFHMAVPHKATLLDWEKRAFELRSVLDQAKSGRRITRYVSCAEATSSVDLEIDKEVQTLMLVSFVIDFCGGPSTEKAASAQYT